MTKRTRQTLGLSLLVSAFTLSVLFIVSCIKKKSILSAILALAALEGGAGAYLLMADDKKKKAIRRSFESEWFDGDEADLADRVMKAELGLGEEEGMTHAPRLHREIPRDEEACEADFA